MLSHRFLRAFRPVAGLSAAVFFVFCLLSALPACGQQRVTDAASPEVALRLEEAFSNLRFTRPVDFQSPGDGSDGSGRVFVVEQAGIVKVFDNRADVGAAAVFLDIRSRVRDQGNEEGLLGLAFHPNFASNGYFYVDYTASNPRRTVVARYRADPNDPDRALPGSETVILEVGQPYSNHNGGQIVFGPDGYLYIALGDGGSGGDPRDHGENPATLLGSILRIDVDGGAPYAIPSDNPFAGNNDGYREEIYAYGLRNPWRISFDAPTGQLWAADVGQNMYEEVNIIESGGNYGWDIMEGMHCYEPSTGCNQEGLTLPVWEYSHDLGISITGGYVYRGASAPALAGRYVFADFGTGRIWALAWDGSQARVEEIMNTNLAIASFGVDARQELYALAFDGRIYRFTEESPDPPAPDPPAPDPPAPDPPAPDPPAPDPPAPDPPAPDPPAPDPPAPDPPAPDPPTNAESEELPGEAVLWGNYPNPFNPETTIRYALSQPGPVRLAVYDLLGHEVAVLVDEPQPAGWHEIRFPAALLPSGSYVYRLQAQDKIMSDTMTLVK